METYETDDELDISWLEEEEKLLESGNYVTESLTQITVYYFYLDKNKTEVHREQKTVHLEKSPQTSFSKLNKEELFDIVNANKRAQYKLFDIQIFHLHLGEDNIQAFSTSTPSIMSATQYLKAGSVLKDVSLEPSVKLFHELSGIYVFYIEDDKPPPLKSILKLKSPQTHQKNVHTKKVRILVDDVSHKIFGNKKSTRKIRPL